MQAPQIAPSQFSFNVPNIVKAKKDKNKDKKKWMDNKPFFGGFGKDTKNKQNPQKVKEDKKVAIRAGGFQPISSKAQHQKFNQKKQDVASSDLVAAGTQFGSNLIDSTQNHQQMGQTHYEHNQFGKLNNKKKNTPVAAGFRINVKKKPKKKTEEEKVLDGLDVDLHDRWVKDPVVMEVLRKHEENIKKAGHNFNDKPVPQIIPKKSLEKLDKKPVRIKRPEKFDESFTEKKSIPDMRSNRGTEYDADPDYIPINQIEKALSKYANDIEQDENYYKNKIEEENQKKIDKKEELKAITSNCAIKRPVLQDNYERVKPLDNPDENKTRPTTEEEYLKNYTREYMRRGPTPETTNSEKAQNANFGGGFSKDLSKSGRSKRKKWGKDANNAIVSTNVDQKLNSRTAAQIDRLANIQIESSKQDMIINEMYANIKEKEKINQELKSNLKPKKDTVVRKAPVPNVPKSGLFSVDNWLGQINGEDPIKAAEKNKKTKKANAKKINQAVERLSQPQQKKPKMDPAQKELQYILKKYDTSERRVGGGAKKKFEYINPVPGSNPHKQSPMIAKKNVNFVGDYSQRSTVDNEEGGDGEYNQYLLSNVHKEEQKLQVEKQLLSTLLTNKSHLNTNKVSEHNTLVDNAFDEILGNRDETTLIEVKKQTPAYQEESDNEDESDNYEDESDNYEDNFDDKNESPSPQQSKTKQVMEDLKYIKQTAGLVEETKTPDTRNNKLKIPNRKSPARSSKDSLNDRTTLNRDLDMISASHSDINERDIDLGEQYEKMIEGKNISELDQESDSDSLNDVDQDLTDLYTGII